MHPINKLQFIPAARGRKAVGHKAKSKFAALKTQAHFSFRVEQNDDNNKRVSERERVCDVENKNGLFDFG